MDPITFVSGRVESTQAELTRLAMTNGARQFMLTVPRTDIPPAFDPRTILKQENQSNMGSCTGHMSSTSFELDAYWASGGVSKPQHSRMMGYLGAQTLSGYLGRDQGASIAGAVEWVVNHGLCLESTFPYPNRYISRIPQAAIEEGKLYRAKTHSPLRSYQLIWGWLSNLYGGVNIGITWTTQLANCNGIVTPETLKYSRRDVLGGHAVLFAGWSERKSADGRNYLWLVNSHGEQWGNRGAAEWHPEAVDAICEDSSNDIFGMTGATGYDAPRRIVGDWGRFVL